MLKKIYECLPTEKIKVLLGNGGEVWNSQVVRFTIIEQHEFQACKCTYEIMMLLPKVNSVKLIAFLKREQFSHYY
jgi:hypothetical protein